KSAHRPECANSTFGGQMSVEIEIVGFVCEGVATADAIFVIVAVVRHDVLPSCGTPVIGFNHRHDQLGSRFIPSTLCAMVIIDANKDGEVGNKPAHVFIPG